jgi:hypothetical protein
LIGRRVNRRRLFGIGRRNDHRGRCPSIGFDPPPKRSLAAPAARLTG